MNPIYCTRCYREKEDGRHVFVYAVYADFVYKGESLCEKHFNEAKRFHEDPQ